MCVGLGSCSLVAKYGTCERHSLLGVYQAASKDNEPEVLLPNYSESESLLPNSRLASRTASFSDP